jgi:hypothetical protein
MMKAGKKITMRNGFEISWKTLIVGAVYLIALMIGGMLASMMGMHLPKVSDVQTRLFWSFIGGAIAGFSLGSIASSMPASRWRHWFVWGSVIFLNIVSVTIEGYFFAPKLIGDSLPLLLVQQVLTALATGWIITILFALKQTPAPVQMVRRNWFSWVWRFLISAFSYIVFYFIFGAINYTLVTKPYYATHAGGLTVPSPQIVLIAELIRGLLIVLSVLPFLLTIRAGKIRLALLTGLILFAIGGLVPLTMQVGSLPFLLLAASAVEIFFQNFLTGVVSARLIGIEDHP